MISYRKTYSLGAVFNLIEFIIMFPALWPTFIVLLCFDGINFFKALLMVISMTTIVLGIVFSFIVLIVLVINLIARLFRKPEIFLSEDGISYQGRKRLYEHIKSVELSIRYRNPIELKLIPKYQYHKEIIITNPPFALIKELKKRYAQNFKYLDLKGNLIFLVITYGVGIVCAIGFLIYYLV